MPQTTDLKLGSGAPTGALSEETALILAAVADHFTEVDPTADLDQHSLFISFGAEAYRLDGKPGNGAKAMATAAAWAAPGFAPGVTRGEYALIVRRILTDAGVAWTEDDNERVIPSIPGPRTEPAPGPLPRIPAQPQGSGAPTCCGRAMTRDGQQWVCSKCKGWHDIGGGK